ncbi:DUF1156 domain-containing protein, partial [Thioalkalivibrio sp. HK1]|uniref:DUF1156 domain-containing protein n=1 Tax=Thioalkalivibrio sp. HK1 TaxID=1469245 RepID=UPI001E5DFD82
MKTPADMHTRKKLIEVALPLDAINDASVQEKASGASPHPRGLHHWWARRPMCAARAVLFSQLVDDPSEYTDELLADKDKKFAAEYELKKRLEGFEQRNEDPDENEEIISVQSFEKPTLKKVIAEIERERLFGIIKKMILRKNADSDEAIEEAQEEIWHTWRRTCADNKDHLRAKEIFDPEKLPAFHDPFAGGGTLPLEASRLGLESHAGDLNPVAVLINKAMIEIPPKFANRPPINRVSRADKNLVDREWKGMDGIAEDIVYYSRWIRDEMEKRIGHYYPKIQISADMVEERPDLEFYKGQELPVISWLWVRTVKSPNPALSDVDVPLASNFMLSTAIGKEAYIKPMIEGDRYRFTVKIGKPIDMESKKAGTKIGRAKFRCLISGVPIESEYIRGEFKAKRSGMKLMAIVVDGNPGRIYLDPIQMHEKAAFEAKPKWQPEEEMGSKFSDLRGYGISCWNELFTSRQLLALTTFSDLIGEVNEQINRDALSANIINDEKSLREGGVGGKAYAEAIGIYLAFTFDRCVSSSNACTRWQVGYQKTAGIFGKQAIPMVWDFSEVGILNDVIGGIVPTAKIIAKSSKEI